MIAEDVDGIVTLVSEIEHDLVVVGPEAPLVLGLADKLRSNGVATFGPSAAAARIEGSKSWANDLMGRYGIPCPQSQTFDDTSRAIQYVESQPQGAVVVKVDGLAAGKGVTVPDSPSETVSAITDALDRRVFGDAGSTIVIEERLTGPELSVFAFVDGETVSAPVAARDYKRAYEGDAGPTQAAWARTHRQTSALQMNWTISARRCWNPSREPWLPKDARIRASYTPGSCSPTTDPRSLSSIAVSGTLNVNH